MKNKTRSSSSQCVFAGPAALKDFFDPEKNPPSPLIEIPAALNPFQDQGVVLYAKLAYLSPLLNIKALPVLAMLRKAEADEKLKGVKNIVEASSGNTGFSLGSLARIFGIDKVTAIVPWDIAAGKAQILQLSGIYCLFNKGAKAPNGINSIKLAKSMGLRKGWINLGQYDNEANPAAFEKWVAPQIWRQTQGQVGILATSMGSTGTVIGLSRYFRKHSPKTTVVGVACEPGQAVPGARSRERLKEIGLDWQNALGEGCYVETGTKESFRNSLRLCRYGIIGGPSSGLAMAGLIKYVKARIEDRSLDNFRRNGTVTAVFICADTALPYLDKYSTHLDPEDF